jgi:hypothetical protein
VICAGCGADLGRPELVGRRDRCPHCAADLRSCRHCRFFEPSLADQCREPQAERVSDKAAANFCDYFAAADAPASRPSSAGASASPRDALERLFRR